MPPSEIAPGLLRWTAPHPEWRPGIEAGDPGDWAQMVGSVLYEAPAAVVLIDPLLPADGREEFLAWLDERVAERPVSVLTTIRWHRRDREQIAARYSENSTRAWNYIPPGVQLKPLQGAGEVMYWLAGVATLVPGDSLLGVGAGRNAGPPVKGLAVCPESWLADVMLDRPRTAEAMRPLLELPIERVLVSHGEPVLQDGRAALARAISEAVGQAGEDDPRSY
jgi:hypothetical protein